MRESETAFVFVCTVYSDTCETPEDLTLTLSTDSAYDGAIRISTTVGIPTFVIEGWHLYSV